MTAPGAEPKPTNLARAAVLAPYAHARVLVVDDNDPSAQLVLTTLRRSGLSRVEAITDPRLALEHVHRFEPELLLLDLHMPHMDGYAILDALRHSAPGLAVLVLTADTTTEATRRAFELGARDFLTKPVDTIELALRVRTLLHVNALQGATEQRERWTEAAADVARALNSHADVDPLQLLVDLARTVTDADLAVFRAEAMPDGSPARDVIATSATVQHDRSAPAAPSIDELVCGDALEPCTLLVHLRDAQSLRGTLAISRAPSAPPFSARERELAAEFLRRVGTDADLAEAEATRRDMLVVQERHRIARDLHDHVLQRLFAIGLQIETLTATRDPAALEGAIAARVAELNETIDLIRTTIFTPSTDADQAASR